MIMPQLFMMQNLISTKL